jgi:hypothetical protein
MSRHRSFLFGLLRTGLVTGSLAATRRCASGHTDTPLFAGRRTAATESFGNRRLCVNGIDDRSRARPAVMASLGAVAGQGEKSVANVVVRRPVHRAVTDVVAGAVLGLLAFAADAVDGSAGLVMVALVSSGLAWGSAALLAGHTAPDRRSAVTGATVLLVSATLVYYFLILVVSRRWSGGYLVDGSSADRYGLRSLAVMTMAWLLVSVVAGPSLGLLGQMTRTARLTSAALAAGAAYGLLSGQGWQEIGAAPWALLVAAVDGDVEPGFLAAKLIQVVLPLVVPVWLVHVQRLWRAWPTLLIAMISTAALSALLWDLLRVAANRFG